MSKVCNDCKEDIEGTVFGDPCPFCGSDSHSIVVCPEPAKMGITAIAPRVVISELWTSLIKNAEKLFGLREYTAAIVVAATACEVVSERAISGAFDRRHIPDLEGPVTAGLRSYSLSGDGNRNLYNALTKDTIHQQPFWQSYKKLVKDRNDAVHSGVRVGKSEAREGIDSAKRFVEHVVSHNGLPLSREV